MEYEKTQNIKNAARRHFRNLLAAVGLSCYTMSVGYGAAMFIEQGGLAGRPQMPSYTNDYEGAVRSAKRSHDETQTMIAFGFFAAGTALLYTSLSMRGECSPLQDVSKQELDPAMLFGEVYNPKPTFSKN